MSAASQVGAVVVLTYAAASSVVVPATIFIAYDARENAAALERLVDYHQPKHEYFFQGANTRGLLDICEREGSVGIYFKEDCEARP